MGKVEQSVMKNMSIPELHVASRIHARASVSAFPDMALHRRHVKKATALLTEASRRPLAEKMATMDETRVALKEMSRL